MTDLVLDGVYSTDPAVMNKFSITGALRAQADAAIELSLSGYAGLTLGSLPRGVVATLQDHSANFAVNLDLTPLHPVN